jgi:hypothetical protein
MNRSTTSKPAQAVKYYHFIILKNLIGVKSDVSIEDGGRVKKGAKGLVAQRI